MVNTRHSICRRGPFEENKFWCSLSLLKSLFETVLFLPLLQNGSIYGSKIQIFILGKLHILIIWNLQRYDNSLLLKKFGIRMHLTVTDVILLALFIPAIWTGFNKGLVRQVAGIAALFLGVWGAWYFSGFAADKIAPYIEADKQVLNVIAFILVFILILISVNLIGKAAEGIVKISMMGWLNKLLGIIFAILKTAFILSILIYLLNELDSLWHFLPKEKFADSEVYSFISRIAPALFPYIKSL